VPGIVVGTLVLGEIPVHGCFLKEVVVVVIIVKRCEIQQAFSFRHGFIEVEVILAYTRSQQTGPIERIELRQRNITPNRVKLVERTLGVEYAVEQYPLHPLADTSIHAGTKTLLLLQ